MGIWAELRWEYVPIHVKWLSVILPTYVRRLRVGERAVWISLHNPDRLPGIARVIVSNATRCIRTSDSPILWYTLRSHPCAGSRAYSLA